MTSQGDRDHIQNLNRRIRALEAELAEWKKQLAEKVVDEQIRAEKAEAALAAVTQESLAWQAHLVQFHFCTHVVEVERAAGRESDGSLTASPVGRPAAKSSARSYEQAWRENHLDQHKKDEI